ncbi:hypothetical protein B8281_15465 [Cellulosimicrobium sp. TH-20]|nr:hypothetical protein B8281_15465 [Cellulosimicrobium sp. TH-20]
MTPGTSCVPDDVAGVVNAIAWEEIERLWTRGLPVCDTRWRFVPHGVGWWGSPTRPCGPGRRCGSGSSRTSPPTDDGDTVDGEMLEQHVRTTVRH